MLDDDLAVRTVLARELRSAGFDAETSSSAQVALISDHLERCAAYVVDLHLRGSMDGVEFVERLRARKPAAVVVYLTGDAEAAVDLLGRGELALSKPWAHGEIGRMLWARLGNGT